MWDDILIVAQMKRIGINEIYSNDKDFDRIPQIKRIF
jgi:predicted nucleic acid-binding protein